jgi:hypothetical protein
MVYLTGVSQGRSIAAFALLLIIATARIVSTYSVFNDTVDESWHIGCGMVWLSGRTYDCNPEHPPLARGMMALGPYLAGARDTGQREGALEGRAVLHHGGNFDRMLALARLGVLPFFWLAALVVYLWARRSFGEPAAFFATVCFTMFPSALAHGGLATTDMPATASIGAAFLAMLFWLEKPGSAAKPLRSLLFGAALALAVLSKFSSLAFLPSASGAALAGYLLFQRPRLKSLVEWATLRAPSAAIVAATAAILIWAGYLFHFAGAPAPELWQGIRDVINHNSTGHPGYLLGHYGEQGWWYFYPVAIFFKTPLAFLALLGVGIFVCWKHRAERGGAYVTPLAFSLGILIFASAFSHINLGIRHVLPVYVAFSVIAGVGAQWLWSCGFAARAILSVLLGWFAVSSALSHPDYLAYFNALAGGEPERILVDSDLDWGQDMKRLAQRLKQLDVKELAFDPFNGAYVQDLQDEHEFPPIHPLDPRGPAHGWNAGSLTILKLWRMGFFKSDPTRELWTDRIPLTERVGKSVLLWYVP